MATLEAAGTATLALASKPAGVMFKKLTEDAVVPVKSHATDAGYDLVSVVDSTIPVGERRLIATGIAVAIPNGWVGLVAPRSGLAIKHGISVTNAPGIVDSGYRGELMTIVHNLGQEEFQINKGDRIAQLVVTPYYYGESLEVDELPEADRGDNGFGSTGR